MARTDHRGKGNFKKNHPNTGQKPSTVDRVESSTQQGELLYMNGYIEFCRKKMGGPRPWRRQNYRTVLG